MWDSLAARFGFECWRQAWSTAPVNGYADGDRGTILLEYGGHPVVVDDIVLAAALFEGLISAKLDAYRGSIYSVFETQFGVRMFHVQRTCLAIGVSKSVDVEARLSPPRALASRRGMPV